MGGGRRRGGRPRQPVGVVETKLIPSRPADREHPRAYLMREAINMPSDMQSAQGRGRSRDRTAERVGLTRHTTRGGSSRALEERYKCMRCNCMWKGSCSRSVRVTHDVPHAGGSPCEVAASGRCRWQPPQGGQSVSQSVSRGKAAHVCGRKDVSKGGSRQPPDPQHSVCNQGMRKGCKSRY